MTRAVIDVNVFISALISPEGVAARLVQHTANRNFELVMSPQLVRELATVTQRSRFRQYFSIEEAERLITEVRPGARDKVLEQGLDGLEGQRGHRYVQLDARPAR